MATCKDCFHFEVCDSGRHIGEYIEDDCIYSEGVEEECLTFTNAVDVVKARHGEWIYDSVIGAWRCSECECKNDNLGTDINSNPYSMLGSNFCPHCSAKMTGGEKSD